MITKNDKEYIDSKKVKTGERLLPPLFVELLNWINEKYDFHFFNIIYDTIMSDSRPRLYLITDYPSDESKYTEPNGINFNPVIQDEIKKKFVDLVLKHGLMNDFNTDKLFVCFGEFSSIAKSEAMWKITNDKFQDFINKYKNEIIWNIHPIATGFGLIVFYDYPLMYHFY